MSHPSSHPRTSESPRSPHPHFVRSCACGASLASVVPVVSGIGPCAHRGAMLSCHGVPARTSPLTSRPVSLTSRTPLLLSAALARRCPFARTRRRRGPPRPRFRERFPPDAPLPFDTSVLRGTLPNGIHYLVRRNVKPENRAELRLVGQRGLDPRERPPARRGALRGAYGLQRDAPLPEGEPRQLPRARRREVRPRPQRVHLVRRDGVHARGSPPTRRPSSTPRSTSWRTGPPVSPSTRRRSARSAAS